MPKFELYEDKYATPPVQTMEIVPEDGDLRINKMDTLEKCNEYGSWIIVGRLNDLFLECEDSRERLIPLEAWKTRQDEKDKVDLVGAELEGKFDDLASAGKHLRMLEKMLRVARKSYDSLETEVHERLKTFERLDVPYEN